MTTAISTLNLTYVTPRVIVIGSPYLSDTLVQLKQFLNERHKSRYRVFNLSNEPEYNIEIDLENVESFTFNAGNPCPLSRIAYFCTSVASFLNSHRENVIVVHCKTGKGRSCLLVACFLLHTGVCRTAEDAISLINQRRSPVFEDAISVPSQLRYVNYYELLLRLDEVSCKTYRLNLVRINTVPIFNSSITNAGCSPHLSVSVLAAASTTTDPSKDTHWFPKRVYNQLNYMDKSRIPRYRRDSVEYIDFFLSDNTVLVRGDVCLCFFSQQIDKMCQLYFNTSFIGSNHLVFDKNVIDLACDDARSLFFEDNFSIEVLLEPVDDCPAINRILNPRADKIIELEHKEEMEFMYKYGDTNILEELDDNFD